MSLGGWGANIMNHKKVLRVECSEWWVRDEGEGSKEQQNRNINTLDMRRMREREEGGEL